MIEINPISYLKFNVKINFNSSFNNRNLIFSLFKYSNSYKSVYIKYDQINKDQQKTIFSDTKEQTSKKTSNKNDIINL